MGLGEAEGTPGGFLVEVGEVDLSFWPSGILPRLAERELLPEEGGAAPPAEPGAVEVISCDFVLARDAGLDTPFKAPLMKPLLVDPFLDALEELESDVDVAPMELRPMMSALDFRKLSILSRCKASSSFRFSSCSSLLSIFHSSSSRCLSIFSYSS